MNNQEKLQFLVKNLEDTIKCSSSRNSEELAKDISLQIKNIEKEILIAYPLKNKNKK